MYSPPARPLIARPPSSSDHAATGPSASGTRASVASVATPITMALAMVPSPGHCRSGIHSSSTANPTTITTVPNDQPR